MASATSRVSPRFCSTWSATLLNSRTPARSAFRRMQRIGVSLCVSDTGPGIPYDERERIFDKFHQVDSTSTKTKGGTGLGLAIAKDIIEMHQIPAPIFRTGPLPPRLQPLGKRPRRDC